jgi:hypothetical protein
MDHQSLPPKTPTPNVKRPWGMWYLYAVCGVRYAVCGMRYAGVAGMQKIKPGVRSRHASSRAMSNICSFAGTKLSLCNSQPRFFEIV